METINQKEDTRTDQIKSDLGVISFNIIEARKRIDLLEKQYEAKLAQLALLQSEDPQN